MYINFSQFSGWISYPSRCAMLLSMEVASSADDVASVEVLVPIGRGPDVQFSLFFFLFYLFIYLFYVARRCLHKALSLASSEERSQQCEKWE